MRDEKKTKSQLISELKSLHKEIFELKEKNGNTLFSLNSNQDKNSQRIEQVLKERQELALSGANEGIWDWYIDENVIYFDSRYYTIAGYTPYEFPEKKEEFYNIMSPDVKTAFKED